MKQVNIKHTITYLITALFLSACGGDSAKFGNAEERIELQNGVEQIVSSGDKLVQNDDNTTIKVIHQLGSDTKKVKLLSGSATLIKGNYEIAN